jgi:hypothetical protein
MIPGREAEMRAAVYERQHGLTCDDADLLFIELDAERATVAKLRYVAEAARLAMAEESREAFIELDEALAALEATDE